MSRRVIRPARRSLARRPNLEGLESRRLLAQFSVTTTADSGPGSLRTAIIAANTDNTVGADTISFNIPGGGPQTIALSSPLPTITRTLAIDATTEPGYSTTNPQPLVVIDGSAAGVGANGLVFAGDGGSFVRGLSIVGFVTGPNGGGSGILLTGTAGGNTIEANYIGVTPGGVSARPNTNGIVVQTAGNKIGAAGTAQGNLISGNVDAGVLIAGAGATGNTVRGNRIGTDASGFFAVGNTTGVILAAPNNTVGGTAAGAGNVISGNVGPTGQTGVGVLFEGVSTSNVVQGNLIGTDSGGGTGTGVGAGAVNNVYGIYFGTPGGSTADNVTGSTIGGTVQGAGNVISGNFLGITGNVSTALIAGNTIGLASNGTRPVPNGAGILLGALMTTIGGTTAAARNVISASSTSTGASGAGIDLTGDSDLIQGNYVGLTSAGLGAGVGNVNGIVLHVTNSTVGGTARGAGNVIAGNSGNGLTLDNNGGNLIAGNLFGRTLAAPVTIPNGGSGIVITLTSPDGTGTAPPLTLNDTIGGTAAGAGNTITASTGGPGIVVHSTYPGTVTGLMIRHNPIFGNGGIGIDLVGNGVPAQGSLFVTSSSTANGQVTLGGIYTGFPGGTNDIDLFGNTTGAPVDPSGYGPGEFYLGSTRVSANASGFAPFSVTFPVPQGFSLVAYSATVTDTAGNTSEFSANFPTPNTVTQADLVVTSTPSASPVTVGSTVTFTEKVTNSGPGTARNVLLTDSLPPGFVNVTVTSSTGSASVDGGNVVTAPIGTLAAGQSATVTITGVASQQGTLADAPGVSSTTFDPNFANNQATQSVAVNPVVVNTNADLAITKITSPDSAVVGADLTYTVTVKNNGPTDATNVTVNDFLPAGVTLLSTSASQGGAASVNGTLVTDNLGSLASGASATLTLIVRPTAAGTITNSANVSGNQPDSVTGNNTTSVTTVVTAAIPRINLQLTASTNPSGVGTIGQIQLFVLTVTNAGPDPATNVTIINSLPTGAVFLVAAPSQGGYATLTNNVLVDDLGTIAAGASATLVVALVPTAPGALINFAGVYTPDVPTAAPAFAYGAVFVPSPVVLPSPGVVGLAGTGKLSQLVVTFSSPLDPLTATNRANYALVATGSRGKNRSVAIAAASYNQNANSVNLVPAKPLDPKTTYRLVLIGSAPSGLAGLQGQRLLGSSGVAGTDYTFNFLAGNLPQV